MKSLCPMFFVVAAAVGFSLALASCAPPPCAAENCSGCCDQSGACVAGNRDDACGVSGESCFVCSSPQVCAAGICADVGGGGGNGAGGGAGGGVGGGTGGAHGSGSLTGQEAFVVVWAGTFFEKYADGGYNYSRARVMLSGAENAVCSPGVLPNSANNLHVTFFVALTPRSYSLAEAFVKGGVPYAGFSAATGTVTLTSVTQTGLAGSLDVSTSRGDGGLAPLTGTFTAPACSW